MNDRSIVLRSATLNGPTFLAKPLAMKSTAFNEPRYGVPNVISMRVCSQPPRHSRKYRATSPPIECPMRTSLASAFSLRCSCNADRATSLSRRAATRLSRRQSYGKGMNVLPGTASNVLVIIAEIAE